MHLHMHTHIHIKEILFCLVGLLKSQNQLHGELWDLVSGGF